MNWKVIKSISLLVAITLSVLLVGSDAHAIAFTRGMAEGANSAKGIGQATDLFGQTGVFRTLTNVLLYLIGAISVIMLIVGGLRYVVSGGSSEAVQGAKNTILYAIVGVVVAILSYAAVSFVIGAFTGDGGVGGAAAGSIAPTNS